jgi:dyslexia susceptibility 1 candidate gene 1 protein
MPVTPEFSWSETDGVVRLEVKLTSATSFADHDVVATDVFVKVNCPPYLLQLDLFGSVVPEKTEVTVSKPCIKFKFFKQSKVSPSFPSCSQTRKSPSPSAGPMGRHKIFGQ